LQTTFAALTEDFLLTSPVGSDVRIATIYLLRDVTDDDKKFVECLLGDILLQLQGPRLQQGVTPDTNRLPEDYRSVRGEGHTSLSNTKAITSTLYALLATLDDAYLILDAFDQCERSLRDRIELELTALQELGLRVLVTSRIPTYTGLQAFCDHEIHKTSPELPDGPLQAYWQCHSECEDGLHGECGMLLCFPCHKQGHSCNKWQAHN
jgi:hypothetical protein